MSSPMRSAFRALLLGVALTPALAQQQGEVSYADVAPLFAKHCVVCHSGDGAPKGLKLDSLAGIKAGSSSGAVVTPGKAAESELIRRLRGESQPRMPLTGPPWLEAAEIQRISAWIDAGLADAPGGSQAGAAPARPVPAAGEPVDFRHVQHVFLQRCAKCHKPDGIMGPAPEGLRLHNYDEILRGSDRVVVVPGNPPASKLLRRIKGYESPRMPFDGPPWLSEEDVQLVERWIADGARDLEGSPAPMPVGRELRLEGVMDGSWQMQDFRIEVESGTRLKKNPRPGDEVRVRGRVQADGSVRVTRVRRR